ncbi:MAG: 50S ribosomal protein L17 [Brevinematales bacterium]|jgi:large subunit ribosomal protein L17
MRHGDKISKLSRNTSHRKALLRNLASALFKYENIQTTIDKAKALRPYAEKIITKAKNDTLASKRAVNADIKDRDILKKLFEDLALRYKNRNGGYTRIYRLGKRITDGSEMAIIELVEESLVKAAPAVPVDKKSDDDTAAKPAASGEKKTPVKKASTAKKPAEKSEKAEKTEKSVKKPAKKAGKSDK